jgi:hypothetical protein
MIPSNTPMRFRKLRIAFSATCLVACVLLIVLWVRSYISGRGLGMSLPRASFFFDLGRSSYRCPYVYPIMLLATLTAAPWIQWSRRYSVYDLLFVMALTAVALALIVSAAKG